MSIYLPIAELPVNIFLLLGLGAMGGIMAGMFGIGGGFLLTPLLIFIGVPPAVAVASSTNQIIASSFSGFLAHWYRKNVDLRMGMVLLAGGFFGTWLGVEIFTMLQEMGQIDLAISVIYVVFLGAVGSLMMVESSRTILRQRRGRPTAKHGLRSMRRLHLPFVIYFPRSDIKISIIMPLVVGVGAGILVSLMGIGGGFIMIPAMIYLLGVPTSVVVGTSLFQIIFTTALATVLHAVNTQTVDIVLALLLIIGGVVGAQLGTLFGSRLPAEKLRIILAFIVMAVTVKLALGLLIEPENLYSISVVEG